MSIPTTGDTAIQLAAGQVALFGYGSLLLRQSLERTLGRSYTGPLHTCNVTGWRRTWDAAMPNKTFFAETAQGRLVPDSILYLNVRRDRGTVLNGIVFVVDPHELAAYDKRESIYERVDVVGEISIRVEGGPAYLYMCRPEFRRADVQSPRQAAVRRTYVEIVESGLAGLGAKFRAQYDKSSDPVPEHLIIEDRS